jgi:hypothetical protein
VDDRFPVAADGETNVVDRLGADQAQGLQHGQDFVAAHGAFQAQGNQAVDQRVDQAVGLLVWRRGRRRDDGDGCVNRFDRYAVRCGVAGGGRDGGRGSRFQHRLGGGRRGAQVKHWLLARGRCAIGAHQDVVVVGCERTLDAFSGLVFLPFVIADDGDDENAACCDQAHLKICHATCASRNFSCVANVAGMRPRSGSAYHARPSKPGTQDARRYP